MFVFISHVPSAGKARKCQQSQGMKEAENWIMVRVGQKWDTRILTCYWKDVEEASWHHLVQLRI